MPLTRLRQTVRVTRVALHLIAGLARQAEERRGIRSLFARHYSLLARKVAERSAATASTTSPATGPSTARCCARRRAAAR